MRLPACALPAAALLIAAAGPAGAQNQVLDDVWWGLSPSECGVAPAAAVTAQVGFNCGNTDIGLTFACEDTPDGGARCDVGLAATGFHSYWTGPGSVSVKVAGVCAGDAATSWDVGAAWPGSVEAACGPVTYPIAAGTCATFDGTFDIAWGGEQAPAPVHKHLWLDYCPA